MELGNKCRDVVLDGGIEEVRECLMVEQGDDRVAKVARALRPGCEDVQEGLEVLAAFGPSFLGWSAPAEQRLLVFVRHDI